MNDIFDLAEPLGAQPGDDLPTNFLVVGEMAANSLEFEARCRMIEALKALDLPMIFENENGEIMNSDDFPPEIKTSSEADAWIRSKQAPVIAQFAPVIEMARNVGEIKP